MTLNSNLPKWIADSLGVIHLVPRHEALRFLLHVGNPIDFERWLRDFNLLTEDVFDPDKVDVCVLAAMLAQALELYAEAVGLYAIAQKNDPNNGEIQLLLNKVRFELFKIVLTSLPNIPRSDLEQCLLIPSKICGFSSEQESAFIPQFIDTLLHARRYEDLCTIIKDASLAGMSDFISVPSLIFGEPDFLSRKEILESFIEYFSSATEIVDIPAELSGRPHLITIPIWGDRFIELADKVLFRCLMAPNNLPKLAEFGTVSVRITTLSRDIKRLESLQVLKLMKSLVDVQIVPFPRFIDLIIARTGNVATRSLVRRMESICDFEGNIFARKANADRSWLTADVVIADGYFYRLKLILLRGYNLIGSSSLRAVEKDFLFKVQSEKVLNGDAMSFQPSWLFRTAIQCVHPFFQGSFAKDSNFASVAQDVSAILSRTEGGFAIHCFQLSVVAIGAQLLSDNRRYDGLTCDVRFFLDSMVSHKDGLLFTDPNLEKELVVIVLDTDNSFADFGARYFDYRACFQSMTEGNKAESELKAISTIFEIGIEIELPDNLENFVPHDAITEDKLLEEWRIHLTNCKLSS